MLRERARQPNVAIDERQSSDGVRHAETWRGRERKQHALNVGEHGRGCATARLAHCELPRPAAGRQRGQAGVPGAVEGGRHTRCSARRLRPRPRPRQGDVRRGVAAKEAGGAALQHAVATQGRAHEERAGPHDRDAQGQQQRPSARGHHARGARGRGGRGERQDTRCSGARRGHTCVFNPPARNIRCKHSRSNHAQTRTRLYARGKNNGKSAGEIKKIFGGEEANSEIPKFLFVLSFNELGRCVRVCIASCVAYSKLPLLECTVGSPLHVAFSRLMLTSLLSGGADASSSRLTSASRGRSGEVVGVSSRRVSRLTPLRACRASPLVLCAAGGRNYTSRGGRDGGVPRVPSPSLTRGRPLSPAELTGCISGCSSGEELLSLVEQHLASYYINAAAALAKLAKLQPVEQWKDDVLTTRLVLRAGELLGDMGERELANSFWACSKLGVTPAWLSLWVELSRSKLATMNSFDLFNSIYAFCGLGQHPGEVWLSAFYTASVDMSFKAEFEPQVLSNILYSLALLKESPDAIWMNAFWSASNKKMAEFKPQELSNTIWAAATLRIFPPADWLTSFWAALSTKMEIFTPQAFSNTIWAAATLDVSPPTDWQGHFCDLSKEKTKLFKPQELSNTVWAFAVLRHRPTNAWLQCFFDASLTRLA